MDRGLWRYTRHPNYFGDFCMWWGLFLISLGSWAELPTIVGPLLMTFLLTRGSGQALTERRMADRPQYADYVARTSGFFPRPPKRRPPNAAPPNPPTPPAPNPPPKSPRDSMVVQPAPKKNGYVVTTIEFRAFHPSPVWTGVSGMCGG